MTVNLTEPPISPNASLDQHSDFDNSSESCFRVVPSSGGESRNSDSTQPGVESNIHCDLWTKEGIKYTVVPVSLIVWVLYQVKLFLRLLHSDLLLWFWLIWDIYIQIHILIFILFYKVVVFVLFCVSGSFVLCMHMRVKEFLAPPCLFRHCQQLQTPHPLIPRAFRRGQCEKSPQLAGIKVLLAFMLRDIVLYVFILNCFQLWNNARLCIEYIFPFFFPFQMLWRKVSLSWSIAYWAYTNKHSVKWWNYRNETVGKWTR